jgi:hypothetical protein
MLLSHSFAHANAAIFAPSVAVLLHKFHHHRRFHVDLQTVSAAIPLVSSVGCGVVGFIGGYYTLSSKRMKYDEQNHELLRKAAKEVKEELVASQITNTQAQKADLLAAESRLKGDIATLRTDLTGAITSSIATLRTDLKGDITTLRTDFRADLTLSENRLIEHISTMHRENNELAREVGIVLRELRKENKRSMAHSR